MIHLDLFSGTGGFALALKQAGVKVNKHYFSEINEHAIANYLYNFPHAKPLGTIEHVQQWNIKQRKVNIITFGSPCEDFSLAGKRAGLEGNRSSLIEYAILSIKRFRPDIFIWENVKGAFSTNDGADFWAIIQAFANIGGYRLEWQLFNSTWFLPQNRERIYLIGHLDQRSTPGILPYTGKDNSIVKGKHKPGFTHRELNTQRHETRLLYWANSKDKWVNEVRTATPALKAQSELCRQSLVLSYTRNAQGQVTNRNLRNKANTIHTSTGGGGNTDQYIVDKPLESILDFNAFTLNDLKNLKIRTFTENELEMLQGFPVDWTKYGNYNGAIRLISDNARRAMCGKAITVDVAQWIMSKMQLSL